MTDGRRLACFFNWLAIDGLVEPEAGWIAAIKAAGYDGIQLTEPVDLPLVTAARAAGLRLCGSGRVNLPADALQLAYEARQHGLECLTLHVGWGIEEDDEAAALVEAVLAAWAVTRVPLFVETHRATIFQDMWRTVRLVRRFPALRFNGDFSHWYTGQEMVYGGFERKLAFIAPVIERTRFLHGRIGTPGCIQVDLGSLEAAGLIPYVDHFRTLWTSVFAAALRAGEAVGFAVELLGPDIFYARQVNGREEGDRWAQSRVVTEIARECFRHAASQMR